jgi:dipeptide/tripeptide permease
MYGQQKMDEQAVAAVAADPQIEVVEINDGDESHPEWQDLAAKVYGAGQVSVSESVDAHGAATISVSLADGATPTRTVAFLRQVESERIAVFVIDQESFSSVYDGYRERFGREPDLLPPGQFMPVINPEVYQSWNPFWVIFLTPVVVAFFQWRVRKGAPIPTARKLLYGMMLTTGALLLMAVAGLLSADGTAKVSGLWLMSFYLVVTFGELCLSPMGLSLVTKLSPKRLVGLTMGGWFMATAFGNNFSGFFGGIQHMMSPVSFFLLLAGLAGLVALFIFSVLPKLNAAITKYGA